MTVVDVITFNQEELEKLEKLNRTLLSSGLLGMSAQQFFERLPPYAA